MGRVKKRVLQCRTCKKKKPTKIADDVRYVISSLIHGLGEQVSREFCLENGILPPSKKTFYKIQRQIKPVIEARARASCAKAISELEFGDMLLHDGAWANKRNAPHMILTYMTKDTKKIVDYAVVSKYRDSSDKPFSGASNEMESFGHKLLAPKWRDDPRIVARVHDQDTNSYKDFERQIDEVTLPSLLDSGHTKKKFEKMLNESNLDGIKGDICKRYHYIVRIPDLSMKQRKDMWLQTKDLLISQKKKFNPLISGVPSKKLSAKDIQEEMQAFLENTLFYIEECSGVSTNHVEGWNAYRAKATPKNYNFPFSWRLRTELCIIKWNERDNFWNIMEELFHLSSLPEECEMLLKEENERKK